MNLTTPDLSPAAPHAQKKPSLLKKQLILLVLLLGARGIGTYAIPEEVGDSQGQKRAISLALPTKIGAWSGRDVKVDPIVYEVLQPDAVLQKRFRLTNSLGQKAGQVPLEVEVLVVYSRDPKGLHSPVTCMRAQGWTISDQNRRAVNPPAGSDGKPVGKTLWVDVLTGQQRGQRTQLAYCFTDEGDAVSGRVATFAKMMLARVLRRRVGAVEMQFAYDARALRPNGDFSPELATLMLQTASAVRKQLGAQHQSS